jgi:hypothetical protein
MSNVALTYWQGGLETTPGTPVAATKKLYEIGPIPEEEREKEYIKQSRQNFLANFDVVETNALVKWKMKMPTLSYDDIAWWNEMALKGGVSPTGSGPYTRVYNGTAASNDLKAATLEVSDGVGAFQIPYALVNKWEFKGKGGNKGAGVISADFDLIAQKVTPGHTMTGALSDRDIRATYAPFVETAFYLNDTAGAIGTTEIGTLMEFSIKADNKYETIFFGNDSGYYAAHRRDERFVEFMVKLLFDSTSYSEFQNKFRANSGRFCQLKMTKSANYSFTWNFYTKWDKFEWPQDGPTRAVSLVGRSVYDATLGYDWQATLVNQVAAV